MRRPSALALLVCSLSLLPLFSQEANFSWICKSGSPQAVQAAVDKGADVNAPQPDNGMTPLIAAARYNTNILVTAILVKAGAEVDARDRQYGATALMWAANANPTVVRTLLKAGADISARDLKNDATPLMWAASDSGSAYIIPTLINAGADINAVDKNGRTALHCTASIGVDPAGMIVALLKAGADAKIKDRFGKTALDYAQERWELKDSAALAQLEEASR